MKTIKNPLIQREKDGNWSVTVHSFKGKTFTMFFDENLEEETKEDVERWLIEMDMMTVEQFIGMCFHLIQQCGGKLKYDSKHLKVKSIDQTSGFTMDLDEKLLLDNITVRFGDL
jgi:hypothetical protein